MPWPKFTWDPTARQYRDSNGRFVPRRAVRQALDEAIEIAKERIAATSRDLQSGRINLPQWQITLEQHLKAIHTMSAAAAAGGWAQATAKDWATAGNRVKKQFKFLENFAYQIENGLPLDGRFLHRASTYAAAGSGTYERVLRGNDLTTAIVLKERRLLHSAQPCTSCLGYHALAWQRPGTLPDIGEECECGMRCQCTFERKNLPLSAIKFKPSERAAANDYETVVVDVARLDAGFQRDVGFAIGRKGQGAIGGRLAGFRDFLRKAVPRGTRIEQPEITIDDDGTVSFTNGRHRFAVLRDMGLKRMPVSVPQEQADLARKLFGPGKPKPKPAPKRKPEPPPRGTPVPRSPLPVVPPVRVPIRTPAATPMVATPTVARPLPARVAPRPPVFVPAPLPAPPPASWFSRVGRRARAVFDWFSRFVPRRPR